MHRYFLFAVSGRFSLGTPAPQRYGSSKLGAGARPYRGGHYGAT